MRWARLIVLAAAGVAGSGCDRGTRSAATTDLRGTGDTVSVLRVIKEDPAGGVGILEVWTDGRATFHRTGLGDEQQAALGHEAVAALEAVLRRARLCELPTDSGTGLVTRLAVEARWPGLACRVGRSEAAWDAADASRAVRQALGDVERRVCGGPCSVDVQR